MTYYADIIVDIAVNQVDRVFQYRVPECMESFVKPGCQVLVPFGNANRKIKGFIIAITNEPLFAVDKIKDIERVELDLPSVEGQLIALADWMSRQYGSTMVQALKTVLPVKKNIKNIMHRQYAIDNIEGVKKFLEKTKSDKRYQSSRRILEMILSEGVVSEEFITGTLQISKQTLQNLVKKNLITVIANQIYRQPILPKLDWQQIQVLNNEQQQVVDQIWKNQNVLSEQWSEKQAVHLIHGVTGSGKTEIYMALIDRVIQSGKDVIVLIPEISLTAQTVARFYDRFGNKIAVMHSKLSAGEKYDQMMRAKNGDAKIMIGARSALFTPFSNLGLIIIDEEHEGAYKSETMPRYHARETAIERARMSQSFVVLGSATPSVFAYKQATEGKWQLHTLMHRAKLGSVLPDVEIIDLKKEFQVKNKSIISRQLYQEMKGCLERGEQMMIFINRRGYAGFVSCRQCGHVIKCPHCDVSLTVHQSGFIKCHYCGYEQISPTICPVCGSKYIAKFGTGTQKVEDMLKSIFPTARVLRMDKDTTSGKDDMGKILKQFSEKKADILVGTQMIVKGHDYENVTLVGVLAADLSMFSGDYMSSERTFQLLTQAAGRAGRGNKKGKVLIQTYQPEHYCIMHAAKQDYLSFYESEMKFRKIMGYPPSKEMMMILCEGSDDLITRQSIEKLKALTIEAGLTADEWIGPAKAILAKVKDRYRYTIYIKDEDRERLTEIKNFIEGYIKWSGLSKKISIYFDFNPISIN